MLVEYHSTLEWMTTGHHSLMTLNRGNVNVAKNNVSSYKLAQPVSDPETFAMFFHKNREKLVPQDRKLDEPDEVPKEFQPFVRVAALNNFVTR